MDLILLIIIACLVVLVRELRTVSSLLEDIKKSLGGPSNSVDDKDDKQEK